MIHMYKKKCIYMLRGCEKSQFYEHLFNLLILNINALHFMCRGGSMGGHTRHVSPLKLEKIWFLGVKSWFFTRNTSKIFVPPFARHNFFKCTPPNFKSWIRPWCGHSNHFTKHAKVVGVIRSQMMRIYFRPKKQYQHIMWIFFYY